MVRTQQEIYNLSPAPWILHILCVSITDQSMNIGLIGEPKCLWIQVNVCASTCPLSNLCPDICWDRLQHPHDPDHEYPRKTEQQMELFTGIYGFSTRQPLWLHSNNKVMLLWQYSNSITCQADRTLLSCSTLLPHTCV